MATLAQRNTGRGVTAYDPIGRLGQRVAPTSRTSSPPMARNHVGGGGGSLLSQMAARSSAQTAAKKEEKKQYGTGLGYLLNNPITEKALGAVAKPLEILDYGRRGIALGVEQAALALPEIAEFAVPITKLIDEDRVREDDRSNREKFFDPGYGWGQTIHQFDTNNELLDTWGNRVTGFLADVAFDPLTYVTAGVGGVVGKSGRAGYSAAARVAGREAVETAARNGADEAAQALIRNRWIRASDEIGRYGPGVIKDADILEAINLQKQGLRFGSPFSPGKGLRIGGDSRVGDALGEVARKTNKAVAKARAGFYDTGVGTRLAEWRTPENIVKAHKVIRGGGEPVGGMEMPYALGMFMFHEGDRLGSKQFRGEASPGFDALAKGLRGDDAVEATRQAERGGTAWNQYGDLLHKKANQAGVEIPYRKNFVPNILTNEGKELFRQNEDLRKLTGVMVTHLDDPSGVTLERQFVDGRHNINGIEVDFGSGTIDEKNRALRDAFGIEKAYDDNITVIYSKYVNRLSSDVGLMTGLERLTDQMPDLVVRSDDPEGILRAFHDVVNDAETTKANQDVLPALRARLSRIHTAVKDTDDRALEALEKGRSILADVSGENLSRIRSFRDSTRRVLAQLERDEVNLVKRRDKIVGALDGEISDMVAREEVLHGELARLRAEELAAKEAIANSVLPADKQAAALERATAISAAKRKVKNALSELQADRDQVDSLSNTLRGAQLKQEILGRTLGDTTITPRPLEAFPTNVPGPRDPTGTMTKGESFLQLASSGLKPADTNYIFVTDAEKAYNEAIASGVFEELTLPEQRKMMGAADRARRENIDNAVIENVGEQFQFHGEQGRSAQEIQADYEQRRSAAVDREIEKMYREEELAGGGQAPGLTSDEQRKLTMARINKTKAKTALDDFVNSEEGRAWIAERSLVEDVRYLQNPEVRYRTQQLDEEGNPLPVAKGSLKAEADAAKARADRIVVETRGTTEARPRPRNEGAIQAAQSEIRMRMSKIQEFQDQIDEIVTGRTKTGAERMDFDETRRVYPEGYKPPRGFEESLAADTPVRPAGLTRQMRYAEDQMAVLAAEIREIEDRLAELLSDQGTTGKRLPVGARRAQVTAAKQRAQQLADEVKRIEKATNKQAKQVNELVGRIAKHDKTIRNLQAKTAKPFAGTDQSHLDIAAVLKKIDEDEAYALRRAEKDLADLGIAPELRLRTEPAYSIVGNPRLRLPRTREQIQVDIDNLERSGAPYTLPSDPAKREAVQNVGVVFPYNTGDKSSEAIANRILADTEVVAPFRALLTHTGAISVESAQEHSKMVTDLAAMVNSYLNNRTSVNLQNVVNQSDKVRRANEFLARYAQLINEGVEPDDALAQRLAREIVTADLKRHKDLLASMKKEFDPSLDIEAEQLTQAVYQAIEDMSSANSDKQFANAQLRKKGLRPDQERALIEARMADDGTNSFMIDWAQKNIRNNQAKLRRAIANGDDQGVANAERALKNNKQTLAEMRAARKQMEVRLEELGSVQSGAAVLDEVTNVINSMANEPLTPEGAALLSKYMSGEDVEDLRYFAEFGGLTETSNSDEFLDFLAAQLKKAGREAEEAAEGRAPLDALTLAATFQASADYNNARMLFAQMFEDLGLRRGTDLSMETTLGYDRSKDILNYNVMKKTVRRHLEAQRGMSDTDFMMRELESRVHRLETVQRGLGTKNAPREEITGWDEAGNIVKSRYRAGDELPPINAGVDEALYGEMLPQERTAAVAKAQRRQPIEDLRAARQAERAAGVAPGPFRGLPFVSWDEAIFGSGTTPRPTNPVFRAQGEQAARAMRGTRVDIPHPSAALTRGGPSAQARVLEEEMRPYAERRHDLFFTGKRAEKTIAETEPQLREAQGRVKQGEKTIQSLQDIIDTKGTPLPPIAARDATMERVDKRYSGMIGRREEELGQLKIKKDAYNKAITNELEEIGPELSLTRKAIMDVRGVLEGPQPGAREMPPVGGWDQVSKPVATQPVPVSSYTTKQGSQYTINPDGSSYRVKAAGAGDITAKAGPQEPFDTVRFVDPEDARNINAAHTQGMRWRDDEGNLIGIRTDETNLNVKLFLSDRRAGASWQKAFEDNGGVISPYKVTTSDTPALGKQPIEMNLKGDTSRIGTIHVGDEITDIARETPTGMLALPAAGESAASRSVAQRLEKAKESAKLTQKNTLALGYEMGGPAAVSNDFDKVMAEMKMPAAETMFVRNLVAEAVGAEKEGELLTKGAKALESAIAKAEANKLYTVSESLVLANWKPMAEELAKGLDGKAKYYMEQTLAQYMTRINEVVPTNRFWKAIEAYTNFFKTYATMRFDFHIRNATSGVFMNSTDGVPLRYNFSAIKAWKRFMEEPEGFVDQLRQAGDEISDFHGLTNNQLADAFSVALGSGAGGQFAERGVGGTSNRVLLNNPATRLSKKLGEYVEGPMRLAMAMDSMKKGSDVYEALARVTRIHFDYSEVSTFDTYAKRMIPFWTFMSRNLPMQITQMLTKPRWYAGYNSFRRNFSEEGDPLAPEYWSDAGGFQLPRSPLNDLLGTEDPIWLTPDLAHNRLESDLQSIIGTATLQDPGFLSNMNPLFTAPAQLMMKKDFFTGKNYGEKDVRELGGLEKGLQPIFELLGAENGVVPVQWLQSLRDVLPTYDQAARLAPGVVTGEMSELDEQRQGATALRYATGLPIKQLTPAQKQSTARSKYYDELRKIREFEAMQRAMAS